MLTYEYIHQQSKAQVKSLQAQVEEMICQVVETGEFTDDMDSAWRTTVGPQVQAIEMQILGIARETLESARDEQAHYIQADLDAGQSIEIDFIESMVAYWQEQVELAENEI